LRRDCAAVVVAAVVSRVRGGIGRIVVTEPRTCGTYSGALCVPLA